MYTCTLYAVHVAEQSEGGGEGEDKSRRSQEGGRGISSNEDSSVTQTTLTLSTIHVSDNNDNMEF